MSRELFYIGYYLCLSFSPCSTTYTTTFADAITCYIALEWSQYQLLILY